MRRGVFYSLLVLLTSFIMGCSDDEYVYPPALTELLSVRTNASGTIDYLLPDRSAGLRVENGSKYSGMVPDSIYRLVAIYEIKDAKEPSAYIYTIGNVIAPEPIGQEQLAGEMKTDPVNIQSIWRSGDYLNMILLVKAQNKKHSFHFIEAQGANQTSCLRLTLYHDKGEDVEAYTQKAYLSVPLKKYSGIFSEGDPILFTINLYKEGLRTYQFTF
ncbi:hypothetical protein DWW69_04475 [Bacteroides sp. AF16-49]|jgi:hypothetical protein|nr:hypothetical protein DXB63_00265 [Bacteroides sp. OM05-12]RHR78688.1 hypothetical protein DWW69_04475 [Bacteroides sp. AF16-49]